MFREPSVEDALRFVTENLQYTQHGPALEELVSQYPILLAIASELSVHDILNLGLACQRNWSCVTSSTSPLKVSKSLAKKALRCKGLCIQVQPLVPDAVCWLPCPQRTDVKRCQGCGVGVCEGCRFRVTHGTMLTFTDKRHWFFPSRTRSGTGLVSDNTECLVSSFNRSAPDMPGRDSTYEDRYMKKWLCVPCLNKDLSPVVTKSRPLEEVVA